ncbi:MAG: EthD family reductase [Chloroflexota bacterium]|nr:EthD family reductase [Chloroflexota bacterium]
MLKVLAVIHRRGDMSRGEFVRYWREVHAPLAKEMPGVRRYIINPTLEAFGPGAPPFDGVAELWFDDAAAARAAFASPAGVATTQDVAKFAQAEKVQVVIAEEIAIVP